MHRVLVGNAVQFLGLRRGDRGRERLEEYYRSMEQARGVFDCGMTCNVDGILNAAQAPNFTHDIAVPSTHMASPSHPSCSGKRARDRFLHRLRLKAIVTAARAKNADDAALIAEQKLEIAKPKRQIYGPRSERASGLIEQLVRPFGGSSMIANVVVPVAAGKITCFAAKLQRARHGIQNA
jgi:hypothetical protein